MHSITAGKKAARTLSEPKKKKSMLHEEKKIKTKIMYMYGPRTRTKSHTHPSKLNGPSLRTQRSKGLNPDHSIQTPAHYSFGNHALNMISKDNTYYIAR